MRNLRVTMEKCRMMPQGQTTDAWDVLTVQNLIYEPLVRGMSGQIYPALAKGRQVLEDGKRWIFYLRDHAFFSDGTACTMEDVLFSYEEMRNAKDSFGMPSPYSRYLSGVKFNVLNKKTLEITTEFPNGDIADFLSEIFIRKKDEKTNELIGSGLYRLKAYEPNQRIALEKRTDIYQPSAYDQVDVLILSNPEERLAALLNGDADVSMDLDQLEGGLKPRDGIRMITSANTLSVMAFLNGFEGIFRNPEARLAVNMAIDKERLIHEIAHGLAIPACSIVSPFHCGFESGLQPIAYDPQGAKAIFDRIGASREILIRTPTYMPSRAPQIAEFIASQLNEIGLSAQVDVVNDRPEYARQAGNKKIGDIAIFDSSPHSSYRVLSDKISAIQRGLWWQGVEDPLMDQYIARAHETVDVKQREFAYAKAIRRLNQNPAWLYLYHPILALGCAENARDISLTHEGLIRLPGAW